MPQSSLDTPHSTDITTAETPAAHQPPIVTIIGDSTIDNKLWAIGPIKTWLDTHCKIPIYPSKESHNLSVIGYLRLMLPGHKVIDCTNDGYTTTDVLATGTKRAYRDKVFKPSDLFPREFVLFPHKQFGPLADGQDSIKQSDYIIVSIGGNNIRELLLRIAADKEGRIRWHTVHSTLTTLYDEYLEIIQKIREYNQRARIILMTQYYPDASPKICDLVYPQIKKLGKLYNFGDNFGKQSDDPLTIIHQMMHMIYKNIVGRIQQEAVKHVIVADITSSLNPFDNKNYTWQIEPSCLGGKKIAQMLAYMLTITDCQDYQVYRFYPDFFTTSYSELGSQTQQPVECLEYNEWILAHPAHPLDLQAEFSREENIVFRQYQAGQLTPGELLQRLDQEIAKHPSDSTIYQAAEYFRNTAENLSKDLSGQDLRHWKMSVVLVLNFLQTCKEDTLNTIGPLQEEQLRAYVTARDLLSTYAKTPRMTGQSDAWKKFTAALVILAGIALAGLSIAGVPFTAGTSLVIGCYAASCALTLVGSLSLFHLNRRRSLAEESDGLVNTVTSLPVHIISPNRALTSP